MIFLHTTLWVKTLNKSLMKKLLSMTLFVFIISVSLSGQSFKPYPIPSYQVGVNGLALFSELNGSGNSESVKAKKNGIVKIYSRVPENPDCSATAWWFCLDGLIRGP